MVTQIIREVKTIKPNYLCKCEYCGREFESLRKDAKYCSALCRVTACNARKKKSQNTNKTKSSKEQPTQTKVNSGEGITYFQTRREMQIAFMKLMPKLRIKDMRYKSDFERATGYTYKVHPNQNKIPKFEVWKI